MKKFKSSLLKSIGLAGALLINPARAERLSGTIDNVFITDNENLRGELLQGHNVNAEGLNSDVTDANGFYEITPNSVSQDYRFPQNISEGRLYDIGGRQISKLNKQDLTSRLLPSNVNLPTGKYFITLDNGLTVPHLVLDNYSRTLPEILGNIERVRESSKKSSRTDAIRNLTITGDGYHNLQRSINIEDNTEYNPFMIPVQTREDDEWVYENGLDGLKDYAVGWDGKILGPRPGDLPLDIFVRNSLPTGNNKINYQTSMDLFLNGIENNGELNWFNNDLFYRDGNQLNEIEKGVIFTFTNRPAGGGLAYTHTRARYEDGTPYLWEVEIDSSFGYEVDIDEHREAYQRALTGIFNREGGRVLDLSDNAPQNARGYVMRRESAGWSTFHPQEKQILKLLYNINQRYETRTERPNIRDWYR